MAYVLYEKQEKHIGVIKLDRPEALNALNSEMLNEIDNALSLIENDRDIRAVVVYGEGKSFIAGADIEQMKDMTVDEAYQFANLGDMIFTRLARLPMPVIAAINGYALGGGLEFALSCDIRYASENAKFSFPEVTLGITPGFGGTQRLSRFVGMAKAMELIVTGKMISADEALQAGLVTAVTPKGEVLNKALDTARIIANNAPIAVKEAKAAVRQFWCSDIYTDLEYEAGAFSRCFATNDQKMGMKAFIEKKPHDGFKGE